MRRVPVASSSVTSVGYDEESRTLEIEFTSGETYQYFDVPAYVHAELMAAPSKGTYVNTELKPSGYEYRHVRHA